MPVSAPGLQLSRPGEELAIALARTMKNVSFYDIEHGFVQEALADAHRQFTIFLAGTRDFTLQFVNGYVVLQGEPLVSPHASLGNLIGACHRRGIESLVFRPGLLREEVEQLVAVLTTDPEQVAKDGGAGAALVARGVIHIVSGRFRRAAESDWRWVHATALDVLRNAAASARTGRPMVLGDVQASVRGILDSLLGDHSILDSLIALKGADEYTFVHALNTCVLACELGREIGLSRLELEELGMATLLHDVGKVSVPLGILRKPAALDEAEFAIMKRHPVDGAIVLARESRLPQATPVVAFEHHMHYDFSGYPEVQRPLRLHLYALITNIADVYDALTTARPYRPALSPDRAVQVMRSDLRPHLEPRLLRYFLGTLGPYPWGTLLRLSDRRLAIVARRNTADAADPYVREIVLEGETERARLAGAEVPLHTLAVGRGQPEVLDAAALGIDAAVLLAA